MAFDSLDGTGTKQLWSTTVDASGNLVGSTCVTDPTSGVKQAVGQAHNSDNQTLTGNSAQAAAVMLDFNGLTYDRHRGNVDAQSSLVTINGLSAQTVTSGDLTNHNHKGIQLGVNLTAISASTTMQVTIQGKDVVSGQYYTLLQGASLASTGFVLMTVYPGAPTTSNVSISQVLPRTYRISVTVSGSGTATATIGSSKIV